MARYKATLLTIELEDGRFSFDVRKSGPAIQLAMEKAQQLYNDTMDLQWIFKPGACGPEDVAAQAASAYYTSGFDVFIGPAGLWSPDNELMQLAMSSITHSTLSILSSSLPYLSSTIDRGTGTGVELRHQPGGLTERKAVEVVGHLANSWNVPIITPVGNTGSIADKTVYPRLTRISRFMQRQFVDMVLLLMNRYKWSHLVIFNDESSLFHDLTGITFDSILEDQEDISWTRYAIFGKTMTREDYQTFLVAARALSRVIVVFVVVTDMIMVFVVVTDMIVVLAGDAVSREFMLVAHALGYTSGEFAFFALTSPAAKVSESIWKRNDPEDEAFESVIFLQLAEEQIQGDSQFQESIINASLRDYNYSYLEEGKEHEDYSNDDDDDDDDDDALLITRSNTYAVKRIDALFRRGVVSVGKAIHSDFPHSTQPSSAILQYYEAVVLYAHVLNETLAADEDPKDGLAITRKMWNRTFQGRTGHLVINENGDRSSDIAIVDLNPDTGVPEIVSIYRSDTRQIEEQLSRGIAWPNGRGPPLDQPVCGFVDEKCDFTEETDRSMIIAVGAIFSILLLVGLLVFGLLFRRWRRISKANLWWWKISPEDLSIRLLPLAGSLASIQSGGLQVRLRKLDIRKPTVSADVLHDFKLLRELVAPNLVRVFGACLESGTPAIVTELCPKGSLQDLLGSADFSLDMEFKISLANDIVEGLCYLHGSPLGCHGGLSSATCLIDNRFTVKLTDYCLSSLLKQEQVDMTGQEYKRECLWKAPELLRAPALRCGSKEGDVYSFGIILSEMITRASPYEKELDFLTLDDILERVKEGGPNGSFRPSVEAELTSSGFCELMTSSWCEDPRQRPSAVSLKKHIKALTVKFGQSANLLDSLLRRMEHYANNLEKLVEEKTAELGEEKKKTEQLLYEILPQTIAQRLILGLTVPPEQFDCVTIYFSDIVGFTTISSLSTPIQVVDLLNDLYSAFDETLVAFDVYKVETIGDAYMVVSGLPHRNGNKHAQQIARMSLALRNVISVFKIRHRPGEKLQLRIGLNSGPVCAGVVGVKMPRYCLFGDTVNTASRMESNGEGMKIHMSESTTNILRAFGSFEILQRGNVEIKGKGTMTTYWLIGERPCAETDLSPSTSQA
ncbi:atrial natriuretic peptide receptor 1-like [Babylonia areolata]|uniref:atrial natriuretic peptide receptor 1-like n=1 Tax=Babylonia areolata TaxID=304850 RepID=UPI003FCF4510